MYIETKIIFNNRLKHTMQDCLNIEEKLSN